MKTTNLVIGSVVLNIVMLAALVTRPAVEEAPDAGQGLLQPNSSVANGHVAQAEPALPPPAVSWLAIESDDLRTFAERLRMAGFPSGVIRALITARIDAKLAPELKQLVAEIDAAPFWSPESARVSYTSKYFEAYLKIDRERMRQLQALLGADFLTAATPESTAQRRQYGALSPAKVELVQRIASDYDEMTANAVNGLQGIMLPGDRDRLALLEKEKRADLAAILAPEELADFELRTAPTTARLRTTLTVMDATEEEFHLLFKVQEAYADRINPPGGISTPEAADQRRAAISAMGDELRSALGEGRYADYLRASSSEYRQLDLLAQRENLASGAATRAFALRDALARDSNQVLDRVDLTVEQQRAALKGLAQETRAQIISALGPVVGNSYLQVANRWLGNVERGSAVTFGPENTANYRRAGSANSKPRG